MNEFVKNGIVTVLILFVVRMITCGLERAAERKKNQKADDDDIITAEYPLSIKAIMVFAFCLAALLLVVNIGDMFWNWQIGKDAGVFSLVCFVSMTLLCGYGVCGTVFWRVIITGDTIAYTNYFGFTKHYKATDIGKIRLCRKKTEVYNPDGKKLFVIDDNVPGNGSIIGWARDHGIKMEFEKF